MEEKIFNAIDSINSKINNIQDNIKDMKEDINDIREDITDMREDITDMREEINNIKGNINGLNGEINGIKQTMVTKEEFKRELSKELADVVRVKDLNRVVNNAKAEVREDIDDLVERIKEVIPIR